MDIMINELNKYLKKEDQLKSRAIGVISSAMNIKPENIGNLIVLKKGMTNHSLLFSVNNEKYILRVPGEGSNQLISRKHEAEVFKTISGLGLCDEPVYINPNSGYKITKYLDGIRCCDPDNEHDLMRCMDKLRGFHEMKIIVKHKFDVFEQIEHYESLWKGLPSFYKDYRNTKENVLRLKPFIDGIDKEFCLTHIDAVSDNFLFHKPAGENHELLQLTDWEYAGMQDPHLDIAMFCIYSLYDKSEVDKLIEIYFQKSCDKLTQLKIYAYISMCGLLWSNWCEFKSKCGVEFGRYAMFQYRYAKEYYRYVAEEIGLSRNYVEA